VCYLNGFYVHSFPGRVNIGVYCGLPITTHSKTLFGLFRQITKRSRLGPPRVFQFEKTFLCATADKGTNTRKQQQQHFKKIETTTSIFILEKYKQAFNRVFLVSRFFGFYSSVDFLDFLFLGFGFGSVEGT
jgi:hypothetical protein